MGLFNSLEQMNKKQIGTVGVDGFMCICQHASFLSGSCFLRFFSLLRINQNLADICLACHSEQHDQVYSHASPYLPLHP